MLKRMPQINLMKKFSPNFSASFAGPYIFKKELESKLNTKVSMKTIKEALIRLPEVTLEKFSL